MFLWKRDSSTLVVIVASVALLFGAVGSQTILEPRFSYVGFNEKLHNHEFSFVGGFSSIDGGALQLTPDSLNDDVKLLNTSGRIMYHRPFKLWLADIDKKEEDDIVASFSSYFYINIFRKEDWNAGEGLAFLIAPTADYIPDQSWGQWMGLTNATTDGDPRNQIVAIEFDTEKQDFDPDDNHIGLNINSINSRKAVPLDKFGIVLSPQTGTNYSVWVEYDGKAKLLQVYMSWICCFYRQPRNSVELCLGMDTAIGTSAREEKSNVVEDPCWGWNPDTYNRNSDWDLVICWLYEEEESEQGRGVKCSGYTEEVAWNAQRVQVQATKEGDS